jgi:uncharacterized protein YndB with AHSA1/START domain
MNDLIIELEQVRRRVGAGQGSTGTGHVVELGRTYDAPVEQVWDACTDPARIARWFLPVTGDLRLGGTYQLQGNASGEITRCERPRHLGLTWVFGDDVSIVAVDITPLEDGRTELRLQHTVSANEHWATYGPGATGVGWDLALLGLSRFLRGNPITDPTAFGVSPQARAFMDRSAEEWGAAHQAAGVPAATAREAADRTRAAYTSEPGTSSS